METLDPDKYGPTELRGALLALLDLHETRKASSPLLHDWQLRVARLRITQAHYTTYEAKQIIRIILEHYRSGELYAALSARKEANSPENIIRAGKCINSHAGHGSNKRGNFWCPVCNTGANIYYQIARGRMTGICSHRGCVRLISPEPDERERKPRFANIIPQDIGTFLIESMDPRNLGTYYGVDAVEQTCTCDDFRFRHQDGHLCKHLTEVDYAVYVARAF